MNKTEKKTGNALIIALNDMCETLRHTQDGFVWLTHFVDYADFPNSLKIVFVFDTNQNLIKAKNGTFFKTVFELTGAQLKKQSLHIKRIEKAVFFDTEENNADFSNPNWCRKYK